MSNTQVYYRNKSDLEVNGEKVDSGSLWKIEHDSTLVLVDDDRYVSHLLTEGFELDGWAK